MPIKQNSSGFTLLEVMLAMTLLSIMVVLLFSSLKIGAESWNKGEKKIAEVNEKAVVYQFFKRHLPAIKPLWNEFSDGDRTFSFQGKTDTLQFVSAFPASAARKGLQLFKMKLDQTEKGIVKVELSPFYPTLDEQEWQKEEVVLLENVKSIELSYFDLIRTTWMDSWQEKQTLPALIKIKIELFDDSFWPEMVFALRQTVTEGVFDENELDTGGLAPN